MIRSILLCLAIAGAGAAENLILENSSFETGSWGFEAVPYTWVRAWPQVVQPRVVDDTAAHGRHSLRLDNGSGHDAAVVVFPASPSGGPTPLTLSFWARSAEEGTPIQVQLQCGYKAVVDSLVTLSRTWRRYEVSGQVGADLVAETRSGGRAGWYAPTFRLLPTMQPLWRTVWLDAVQLERGATASTFAPARPLEASLDLADRTVRRLLVYDLGETPTAELRVAAPAAGPFTAVWRLRDVLDGRILGTGNLDGICDAQGGASATIPLPAVTRRLYRIEATVTAGDASATAQRVYGGIANRTLLPGGRFGGSIESYEEGRKHDLAPPDPTYRLAHWREAPETYVAMARRLGWSWIHLYRQTSPLAIMPEPGVFRFEDTDTVVDLMRANDLGLMALLTSHGNYHTIYDFPAWIKTGPKSLGGTSAGKDAVLPDLAAWERWCSAMATRYRGRITAWENWNEPGVKMREAEYLPYAQAAYRAIKAADPQATVLGLCGTWDVGGDLYGWVKGCMKLGAGDTMDAIAIHGYHSRDRDYVAQVRTIAREFGGRDFPIWDTETGLINLALYGHEPHFSNENDTHPRADAAAPTMVAEALARHTANELASGIERLSYFNLSVPWTTLGKPDMGLFNFDGSPDLGVICENFLIEVFQDARPYRSLPSVSGVVAYVFERPTGPLLVYWSEEDRSTARLAVARAKLSDLLGGELPTASADGWTTLPIDRQPRFLTAPDLDAAALAAAAASLEVQGMQPLRLESAVLGLDGDQPTLRVSLVNRTNSARPVTLATRRMPAWLGAAPAWQGTLPALGRATAVLPLTIAEPDADDELRLVAESGERVLALPLALRVMTASAQPRPRPLADWCTLSVTHDANGLRFHGEVRDDQIANHRDCTSATLAEWQGDNVELFFDWERAADLERPAFDDDDTQLICTPPGATPDHPGTVVTVPGRGRGRAFPIGQVSYRALRTATGWALDLDIPWSCAEALGCQRRKAIGFSISVRDVDTDWSERRRMIWAGDNDNFRTTTGFGLLLLR